MSDCQKRYRWWEFLCSELPEGAFTVPTRGPRELFAMYVLLDTLFRRELVQPLVNKQGV
jgi:hypothetical protein